MHKKEWHEGRKTTKSSQAIHFFLLSCFVLFCSLLILCFSPSKRIYGFEKKNKRKKTLTRKKSLHTTLRLTTGQWWKMSNMKLICFLILKAFHFNMLVCFFFSIVFFFFFGCSSFVSCVRVVFTYARSSFASIIDSSTGWPVDDCNSFCFWFFFFISIPFLLWIIREYSFEKEMQRARIQTDRAEK